MNVRFDIYTECGKVGSAKYGKRHLDSVKAADPAYVDAEARHQSMNPGTLRVVVMQTAPMRGDVACLGVYERGELRA